MKSASLSDKVAIRIAHEGDLNAILGLLLTSFRQFSLFDFLYSPLNEKLDYATDTIFLWRQRLLLDLLDPKASIIIAEVPSSSLVIADKPPNGDKNDLEFEKSSDALKWTEKHHLSTVSADGENVIVGFAIWRVRPREDGQPHDIKVPTRSLHDKLRVSWITSQVWMWKKLYQRKDQEPVRYKAYLEAEEHLSKNFYQETSYYLDNLCVDFRYHRQGVGGRLLQWGLNVAAEMKLWVGTEGSPQGLGLYLKNGFKQVGWFTVAVQGEEHRMPVLRLNQPTS